MVLLDQILLNVPCPIFWKDLNGVFLGCNKLFLDLGNMDSDSQLIGKKDEQLPWKALKDVYYQDEQYILSTGKTIKKIENILLHEQIIIFEITKSPLIQDGKIIGILGIYFDITGHKEKEKLILENQMHQAERECQQDFKTIVKQVAHDIRSPLASLQMITGMCAEMSETNRDSLKKSCERISDIASNLLKYFKPQHSTDTPKIGRLEKTQLKSPTAISVSADLLEIINEKRYEYLLHGIEITSKFSKHDIFINMDSQAFKRAISNIINNAVDAFDNRAGKVIISLDAVDNKVQIIIEDNGKGMPEFIREKILNNIPVSFGKTDGHGIGYVQISSMLSKNNGALHIQSKQNIGTKIILTFPSCISPDKSSSLEALKKVL